MGVISVQEFIQGYERGFKSAYLVDSAFACLIPSKKILDKQLNKVLIREVTVEGGSVPYNGVYPGVGVGVGTRVSWVPYDYDYDQTFSFTDDTLDEIQSFVDNDVYSIVASVKQFIGEQYVIETDRLTASTFYSQIPTANKLTGLFDGGFFSGLDKMKAMMINAKVPSKKLVYCFVSASTYAKQAEELRNNTILANHTVLKINNGGIEVEQDVVKYNNFIIIVVPDDIMQSTVVRYDGATTGQEAGGVVVDEDSKPIEALFIPEDAAFVDNKYITTYLWCPVGFDPGTLGELNSNITQLIGDFQINRAGINPESDGFKLVGRIQNGRSIYNVMKRFCFSVEATPKTDTDTNTDNTNTDNTNTDT